MPINEFDKPLNWETLTALLTDMDETGAIRRTANNADAFDGALRKMQIDTIDADDVLGKLTELGLQDAIVLLHGRLVKSEAQREAERQRFEESCRRFDAMWAEWQRISEGGK